MVWNRALIESNRDCGLTTPVMDVCAAAKKAKEDVQEARIRALTLMMELFKDTGTAKIPAINEYLMDILEGTEEKMLLFCHHQDVMVRMLMLDSPRWLC